MPRKYISPQLRLLKTIKGEQNEENSIRKMGSEEQFLKLITQAYRLSFPDMMEKFLKLFTFFLNNIDIYELNCNKNPEAADVSYNAMRG